MEVEAKLTLDPAAAPALRRHALLAHYQQGKPSVRWVENHYFDTPDLDLQRQGFELRLRRDGRRYQQTLKTALSTHGGLHRREEWEAALDKPALDIAALVALLPPEAAPTARLLQAFAARGDLGARVTTRYRRTTWPLLSANGDEVEVALDVGEVAAAGRRLPLCEVELELKAGEVRSLFELAGALHADVPLRSEARGKAERGFALLAPQAESPRHGRPVRMHRSMTPAEALRAMVEECLAQVQGNEAGVTRSADAEYVHQMRVGLRRLRSALNLFKDLANPPAELLNEVRWSAEQLARARDAEVLAHETLDRVHAPAWSDIVWTTLREAALTAAALARQEAAQAMLTPRHVAWQLALMAWVCGLAGAQNRSAVEATPAPTDLTALTALRAADAPVQESLREFAERKLSRLRKRLLALGRRLPGPDAEHRHSTRIAAKKLRYATEMLGTLSSRHAGRRRRQSLAALQQQLGMLNDAEVATTLLARLAADAPSLAQAAAYAQGWLAADAERRVQQLAKLWKRARREF